MRRYSHHSQTVAIKLQNIISVNEELNFEQISPRNEKYALKSVICHNSGAGKEQIVHFGLKA